MTARITGSLVVCAAAAVFTVGALVVNAADDPAPVAAATSAPAAAAGATLSIQNFAFSPVSAKAGTVVSVVNRDSATHTVTADTNAFNTGPVKAGAASSFRAPAKPGRYTFFCAIHPEMTGTLIVT